jgi:hypothetical protein
MNGRYCDNFEKCNNKAAPGHDLCYTCLVEKERDDKKNEYIVDRLEEKPRVPRDMFYGGRTKR